MEIRLTAKEKMKTNIEPSNCSGQRGETRCDSRQAERIRALFPSPSGRGIKGEGESCGEPLLSKRPRAVARSFSLTPALSRWERENRAPFRSLSSIVVTLAVCALVTTGFAADDSAKS